MLLMTDVRRPNPRIGLYFGIYTSLLVAGLVVVLLLEQLDVSDTALRVAMFGAPLAVTLAVSAAAFSRTPVEFFAAGRRVSPVFAGVAVAAASLGGFAVITLTGVVFLSGADAFALLLGLPAGLVVAAVLLVPFLRKLGAHTVPAYLGVRFDNRLLRIVAAAVLAVPALLMLAAELQLATRMAGMLVGGPSRLLLLLLVAVVGISLAAGGMRALTWSAGAKTVAVLLALLVPLLIVGILASQLPLPHITAGNVARNIARLESARAVPTLLAAPWVFQVPGDGLVALSKRFLQSFGHVGTLAYSMSILVVIAGVAGSPTLLARTGTTTGVHAARVAMAWAVLVVAFVLLSSVATAVYLRSAVVEQVIGLPGDRLPGWFQALQQLGLAAVDSKVAEVRLNGVRVLRDGVLVALPIAAGLPMAIVYLVIAGALAAALAAAAAHMMTLGTSLAEDVVFASAVSEPAPPTHVAIGRLAVGAAAIAGAGVAALAADPLELVIWALTITAASSFPVLVLSVFSKRMNAWGAVAGLLTGFGTCTALIVAERIGLSALGGPWPAVLAAPAAVLAALAVSQVTPAVDRHTLEILRDMRVPGGETLVDRIRRLERQKQRR